MPPLSDQGPLFSITEHLPMPLFYMPAALMWPYYALRCGGITLPANANPGIVMGGWFGESKSDVLSLLGSYGRTHLAPFTTLVVTGGKDDLVRAEEALARDGIGFPIVAKPDIGRNGSGVKIVRTIAELEAYLAVFPKGQTVLLQRYIALEGEAGVFYVRKPSESKGSITSLTLKYFPHVVGDGTSTLRALIMRDPRASQISSVYFRRNRRDLDRVLEEGEKYRLVSVGNHVRGALFVDGSPYITPLMTETFDRMSKEMEGFFFGRFDVRFKDIEDLQAGKDFYIVEFNGTGSEPTHIYDRRATLGSAYRSLFKHWRLSFEVGAENRARGARAVSVREVLRRYREERRLLNAQPDEE